MPALSVEPRRRIARDLLSVVDRRRAGRGTVSAHHALLALVSVVCHVILPNILCSCDWLRHTWKV